MTYGDTEISKAVGCKYLLQRFFTCRYHYLLHKGKCNKYSKYGSNQ